MLSRTPRGALLLSAAGVLTFTAVSAILNLLIPFWLTGDIHAIVEDPGRLNDPGSLLALGIIFLAALAALIALGAYWLYRYFGPAYYGSRGAVRWALFGGIFAVLVKLPDWFLPQSWWLLNSILLFLSVFAAFFTARWLVPIQKHPGRQPTR